MNDKMSSMPAALIRLLVGWVFLVEGILKYLWLDDLGVGRFTSIGIPVPHFTAPFVGLVEMVCGALLIVGLFTRLAAIPLLIDISVAILSTKVPILLGRGYWRFTLPKLKHYGLLSMLHEARTDISMVLGLVFILIVGAGALSVDVLRKRSRRERASSGRATHAVGDAANDPTPP
ncbi:MAG TPA: DoxX family protein [Terriglobales bacterium]|nr:DoxX family protein [Terriglobales bacterium]